MITADQDLPTQYHNVTLASALRAIEVSVEALADATKVDASRIHDYIKSGELFDPSDFDRGGLQYEDCRKIHVHLSLRHGVITRAWKNCGEVAFEVRFADGGDA